MNAGWGKGAGSEQSSPMGCGITEEGKETQIIHQNRVVLPTTPLGITLDKPWLIAQSIRAGSSSLYHAAAQRNWGRAGPKAEVSVRELIERS